MHRVFRGVVKGAFFGVLLAALVAAPSTASRSVRTARQDRANDSAITSRQIRPRDSVESAAEFADPNPEPGDEFGFSVAVSSNGQLAIVGAPEYSDSSAGVIGAVYVFQNSGNGTWSNIAQLIPGSLYPAYVGTCFGEAISTTPDGSVVIVGSTSCPTAGATTSSPGFAYMFDMPAGGWSGTVSAVSQLRASDASASDPFYGQFGISVALSGDGSVAVVGADYRSDEGVSLSGEAYVYVEPADGWASDASQEESIQLVPSNPTSDGGFGTSVSISSNGGTIVVGSPLESYGTEAPDNPPAYVFNEPAGGWTSSTSPLTETSQLMAEGVTDFDNIDQPNEDLPSDLEFGIAVSVSADGSVVAVGDDYAINPDLDCMYTYVADQWSAPCQTGSVYVFTNNDGTWSQSSELFPTDGELFGYFGWAVSLDGVGQNLLIGSPGYNNLVGASYLFTNDEGTSWNQSEEMFPNSAVPGTNYGWTVTVADQSDESVATFSGAPCLGGGECASNASSTNRNSVGNTTTSSGAPNVSRATADVAPTGVEPQYGTVYASTVVTVGPPTISKLSSARVYVGSKFIISGTNLLDASVTLSGRSLRVLNDTATSVTAEAPSSTLSGVVALSTPGGSTTSPSELTVIPLPPAPTITRMSANSVTPGGSVTVTGNHMAGATVSLNGVTLKNTVNRLGTSMKVTVSVTSVTGDLVVASIGGSATSSKLTVRSPSAISLGDKSGRVKSSLTIKGKNLAGVNRLMFNGGVTVTKFKVSDSRIVVVVPSGAETGPVTLYSAQAPAGVTTPPFTVLN